MKTLATLILGVLFVGVMGFFVSDVNSPELRYQKLRCQLGLLDLAEQQDRPIKYAFFGSSRSFEAINAQFIQQELSLGGEDTYDGSVFDMSKSWRGNGINYVMLKDLLARQSVEKVFIEANFTNHLVYHPYWLKVANYRYILGDFNSRKDVGFLSRVTLLFDHLGKKFSSDVTTHLLDLQRKGSVGRKHYDCSGVGTGRERPDQRQERRNQVVNWDKEYFEWDIDSDFEGRADFYLKKIAELADERGFELYFTHFNTSYTSPLDPEFVKKFESKYGHRLISVDDTEALESMFYDGYRDLTHMNQLGQRKYAQWFSSQNLNR